MKELVGTAAQVYKHRYPVAAWKPDHSQYRKTEGSWKASGKGASGNGCGKCGNG